MFKVARNGPKYDGEADSLRRHFASAGPMTVLLTGATGNLGAYILHELILRPEISKIWVLHRSAGALGKQKATLELRGLSTELTSGKISFLQVDYEREDLGLSRDDYMKLAEEISIIIHAAWPVNFNRTLSSFDSSIKGVTTLVELALARQTTLPSSGLDPNRPCASLLFCSSIGSTSNWASYASTSRSQVPEVELTEWKLARTGYGQSKLLSERLLAHMARTKGIPVSVVRIGQLAGPVTHQELGSWPPREWIPSLIKSSVALGAIPADLGPHVGVDWIPVDLAAGMLMDFALDLDVRAATPTSKDREARFFHIVNPRMVQWADILPAIREYLPDDVKVVPFSDWVERLGNTLHTSTDGDFKGADDDSNPAIKLWDTFDYMRDRAIRYPSTSHVTLDTKKSVKHSRRLAQVRQVDQEWMELWMRQWGFDKIRGQSL